MIKLSKGMLTIFDFNLIEILTELKRPQSDEIAKIM